MKLCDKGYVMPQALRNDYDRFEEIIGEISKLTNEAYNLLSKEEKNFANEGWHSIILSALRFNPEQLTACKITMTDSLLTIPQQTSIEEVCIDDSFFIKVQWDFYISGDEEWNSLSYEEKELGSNIPKVIKIPANIIDVYRSNLAESEAQAEDVITNWLSDEFGWLHHSWNWSAKQ